MRVAIVAIVLSLPAPGAAAGGRPTAILQLNRVAYAVEGAESSYGRNPAMWHPDRAGPQGPMQVSAAAATDVGGGDRFDAAQNRAIGRAYLAQLHRRYGDWPDAIAAYNWGIGNLDRWIRAGRPVDKLLSGVVSYLHRVLRDGGFCHGTPTVGTSCGPQLLGDHTAVWRTALAEARGGASGTTRSAAGQTRLDRMLAMAALLARRFAAEQAAFNSRFLATPPGQPRPATTEHHSRSYKIARAQFLAHLR